MRHGEAATKLVSLPSAVDDILGAIKRQESVYKILCTSEIACHGMTPRSGLHRPIQQ